MRKRWKTETLGNICQIKPPKNEAKQKLADSDLVSFVPMSDLGQRQKELALNDERPLGKVVGSYTYFADNDVLLAKITPCFENGKLGIARNLTNGVGFGSSEYIVFRSTGDIDPEYLFHFLSQDSFRDAGSRVMTGAVGHKRVPKEFIENYPIPLPPLPEQIRIVAILDEVFEGIGRTAANAEKNLANARELFDSTLQAIFRRGVEWERITLSELIERGWITSHLDGNHGSDYPRKSEFIDHGVPYISANCLRDEAVDFSLVKYLSPERAASLRKGIAQNQDVLFAHNATVGQSHCLTLILTK